jgi:hypothetical protein
MAIQGPRCRSSGVFRGADFAEELNISAQFAKCRAERDRVNEGGGEFAVIGSSQKSTFGHEAWRPNRRQFHRGKMSRLRPRLPKTRSKEAHLSAAVLNCRGVGQTEEVVMFILVCRPR